MSQAYVADYPALGERKKLVEILADKCGEFSCELQQVFAPPSAQKNGASTDMFDSWDC